MTKFKSGDKVRIMHNDHYDYGEVTIVSNQGIKVIFNGNCELIYWYYKPEELELMKPEDLKDD